MIEWKKLQAKWIDRWDQEKVFETKIDESKEKFFGTFPYPYINLYPHIGHFYSLMKLEAMSRFKRMQGYNVLYSQAWHATGSPIVNAAKRVKTGEEKQINILKEMGFSDQEIIKFEDPVHWNERAGFKGARGCSGLLTTGRCVRGPAKGCCRGNMVSRGSSQRVEASRGNQIHDRLLQHRIHAGIFCGDELG